MSESNIKLLKKSFKNVLYSFSAQAIALILSTTRVLLIPKAIGIEEYSYWQLYLFWIGYVGFFHFGFNDGILLKYGGEKYNDLDKELFRSQFITLFVSQFLIAIAIIVFFELHSTEEERLFISYTVALTLIINNLSGFFWCILQSTNRFREYTRAITIDKFLFLLCVILLLVLNVKNFKIYIITYLFTIFFSLAYTIYTCKDLVVGKLSTFSISLKEAYSNISVGIKLMIANIASMLILGSGRFIIDRIWGITTFGKISFSLSITSMVLLFINAISIVLFPTLRQIPRERLSDTYVILRTVLMTLLTGILIFYIPIQYLLNLWLPQYSESLEYLAILFPLCIFEGKMQMLISTYLKVARKESMLLMINLLSVIISVLLCVFSALIFRSITLVVISMVIGTAIRCLIAELYLLKFLNLSFIGNFIDEIILGGIFIVSTWYLDGLLGLAIYLFAYIVLISCHRNNIRLSLKLIRQVLNR